MRTRRCRAGRVGRAKVGDVTHTGVFTDRGYACNGGGFVLKRLRDGHHGSIGCCEPEPDARLCVNEQFKEAGHRCPPVLWASCQGGDIAAERFDGARAVIP